MPPLLALILTLGFIAFLFRRDFRERPDVSGALWLPLIWMFLVASRPVSQWLAIFGFPGFVSTSAEEGSPMDAVIYLGLIGAAVYILNQRRVSLTSLIRENRWLTFFVLYCFVAILWSDFPSISFKRWIKVLGHPIMVVLLFTEVDPEEALLTLMKRCAYLFLPISILWMKYYPKLGRTSSEFGGMANCGAAENKNVLAGICWVLVYFFTWHFLRTWKCQKGVRRRNELLVTAGLVTMACYCLLKAHSATSDMALLLAIAIMIALGLRFVNRRTIYTYALVVIFLLGAAQLMFDFYGLIVGLSGHESTIEGRGRLWEILLATDTSKVFGTGFESYWLGQRVEKIWAMPEFWWHPNQAHNGYLELYLNLGIVGFCIFAGAILVTFYKARRDLLENAEWGRFEIGCLVGILAHNWTEAGFKGLSFPFLIFFILSIRYRRDRPIADESCLTLAPDDQADFAYRQIAVR